MKVFTGLQLFEAFGGLAESMRDLEQLAQPRPARWRLWLLHVAGYDYRDFRPLRKPTERIPTPVNSTSEDK